MKIITFVTTFLFLLLIGDSQSSLESISRKLHRLHDIHNAIHEVIEGKGHNPNLSIVERLMPADALKKLLNSARNRLEACYNATLAGKKVHVFEAPVKTVIHEYLKVHFGQKSKASFEKELQSGVIHKYVHHLFENILDMVKHILDCLANKEANFRPTQVGLTEFSIWPKKEFKKLYLQPMGRVKGNRLSEEIFVNYQVLTYDEGTFSSLPKTFDYRKQGVVSDVKNQAYCGTCFLFGAMAAIESSYMLKYNKTGVSFSEMNILNCMRKDNLYTDEKCQAGGDPRTVYNVARQHGLVLAANDDSFISKIGRYEKKPFVFNPSHCDTKPIVARLKGFSTISEVSGPKANNVLKSILIKYGPVTTYFRSSDAFAFVVDRWNMPCNASEAMNHVMTIVGWDEDYWIIKNSYGNYPKNESETSNSFLPFGVQGYVYARMKNAQGCGIFGPSSGWDFPEVE